MRPFPRSAGSRSRANLCVLSLLTRGPQGQPSPLRTPHGHPGVQVIVLTSRGQVLHVWPMVPHCMATGFPIPQGCCMAPTLLVLPCSAPIALQRPVFIRPIPSPAQPPRLVSHRLLIMSLIPCFYPTGLPATLWPGPTGSSSIRGPFRAPGTGRSYLLAYVRALAALSCPILGSCWDSGLPVRRFPLCLSFLVFHPSSRVYTHLGRQQPSGAGPMNQFVSPAQVAPTRTPAGVLISPFFPFVRALLPFVRTPLAVPCPPPPHDPSVCLLLCRVLLWFFCLRVCCADFVVWSFSLFLFALLPACTHETAALGVSCCGSSLDSSLVLLPPLGFSRGGPPLCQVGGPPLRPPLCAPRHRPPSVARLSPLPPIRFLAGLLCATLLLSAPQLYLFCPHAAAPPAPDPSPGRPT